MYDAVLCFVGSDNSMSGFLAVMSDRFTDASASRTRLIRAISGDSRSHYLAGAGFDDLTGLGPTPLIAIQTSADSER